MSKALIMAVELIKEECSKHEKCKECFYWCVDEESIAGCIIEDYKYFPRQWDLSELEKKNANHNRNSLNGGRNNDNLCTV